MAALNTYPRWKYLLLLIVFLLGLLYALPNIYGEDPAVQIQQGGDQALLSEEALREEVQRVLVGAHEPIAIKALEKQAQGLLVRLYSVETQLRAKTVIEKALPDSYSVALNLAPATPLWLQKIHAEPLKLGLDLRGGVHFLMDVDVEHTVEKRLEGLLGDIRTDLKAERCHYRRLQVLPEGHILVAFETLAGQDQAYSVLKRHFPEVEFIKQEGGADFSLLAHWSPEGMQRLRNDTLEQTIVTLRNRINELGVAESVVQRQGLTRIVVELPGIQDTAHAKDILGKTATLEFVMQDEAHDLQEALAGQVPPGSRIVYHMNGRPVLVKKQTILTGDSISSAMASIDSRDGRPAVNVRVSGGGLAAFKKATRDNVGKQMAVVYREAHRVDQHLKTTEKIISLATIQSALGAQFQITGLQTVEAQNLALLLRAGALPAAVSIVEERTVGPSLGQENIQMGLRSMVVGLGAVLLFMATYYSVMGVIADIGLLINLLLLIAVQSLIGATLTLPGIAGIVLTLGMAVDANVLIFERIREELRQGMGVQSSIFSGFEKAWATIVDANLTTLIAAVILFSIGTGPIRGFAVTLSLGILTSMVTSVTFTRALVNLLYGSRSTGRLRL